MESAGTLLCCITLSHFDLVFSQACDNSLKLKCPNTDECYYDFQRCGGEDQCSDGFDEQGCSPSDCPWDRASKIKYCHSTSRCINTWKVDCLCNPYCRQGETCCTDGSACYSQKQRCDGTNHCFNGADEDRCWEHSANTSAPIGITIGITIAMLVFLIILITVCIVIRRRRMMMPSSGTVMQPVVTGGYIPPQTNQQPYPQHRAATTYIPPQPSAPPGGQYPTGDAPPSYSDVVSSKR